MFESLVDLASGSAWTYVLVFGLATLDVLAPILPSESVVVAAAALAASGRLNVVVVAMAAAAGALLGDNIAFVCGRLLDTRMRRWLEATPRRRERLEWAEHQLDRRGGTIIIGSRFIPGGRTATMVGAGLLEMPWRRFVVFDVAAAVIWASTERRSATSAAPPSRTSRSSASQSHLRWRSLPAQRSRWAGGWSDGCVPSARMPPWIASSPAPDRPPASRSASAPAS